MSTRKQEIINNFFSSLAKPAETNKPGKGGKPSKAIEEEYKKPTTKIVVEPSKKFDIEFSPEEAERKLEEFDLNSDYGPALGISREERYKRAIKLNLNPPAEIGEILERKISKDKSYLDQHYNYL